MATIGFAFTVLVDTASIHVECNTRQVHSLFLLFEIDRDSFIACFAVDELYPVICVVSHSDSTSMASRTHICRLSGTNETTYLQKI